MALQEKFQEEKQGEDDPADDLGVKLYFWVCLAGLLFGQGRNGGHPGFQFGKSPLTVFPVVLLVDKGAGVVFFIDAVTVDDIAVGVDAAETGRLVKAAAAGTKTVLIIVVSFVAFVAAYFGHKPTPFLHIS